MTAVLPAPLAPKKAVRPGERPGGRCADLHSPAWVMHSEGRSGPAKDRRLFDCSGSRALRARGFQRPTKPLLQARDASDLPSLGQRELKRALLANRHHSDAAARESGV
jgi:hypothetical protein